MRHLLIGTFVLALPSVAQAQLTIVSTEDHAATATAAASTTLVVDAELGAATAMVSANADAQLRQAAPQLYAPIDLGVVRYHDPNTTVDAITWHRASDTELGVTVRAHVRARQDHRTLTFSWAADGVVALANVTLEARVPIAFTEAGGVQLTLVGDTLAVEPQLASLGGQTVPLEGQTLGARTIDENPFAGRHLRATGVTITGVDGTVAHARIAAISTTTPVVTAPIAPAPSVPVAPASAPAVSSSTTSGGSSTSELVMTTPTATLPSAPDVSSVPLTGTHPTSRYVDAHCVDGMYAEPLPDPSADIHDLLAAYDAAAVASFVDSVLARRYPFGRAQVTRGRATGTDCLAQFAPDTSSAEAVIRQLDTVVHECGHLADNVLSPMGANSYIVQASLTLAGARGDTTTRGGATFPRNAIHMDDFQASRPWCPDGTFRMDCDPYAHIYLDGTPDDAVFHSGDQGFNMLLEEVTQYVNSLATGYAFGDVTQASGIRDSDRDGILTALWYMQRYLHLARTSTSYASAYDWLLHGDSGRWRRAILTIWGRAWLYLEATSSMSFLGLADTQIASLVTAPELLEEIARVRAVECP
jgi:hypothetical protein